MATKKIILDFKQQPIATKSFKYKIYINGTILTYGSGINNINLNYKVGGNNAPYQIGIGANLAATITNTLGVLNSIYYFSGIVGGYNTSIDYAIVDNTIEVTITSDAPANQIYVWELVSDYEYISFRTATPCETIFLSNQSSVNALPIFAQTPGNYILRNTTLATNKAVTIPNYFDCELQRNYSYMLKTTGDTLILSFGFFDSLSEINVNAYFTENNLIINILQDGYEFLGLLFSINGVDYQAEPLFEDLEIGTYTLRIKDIYGCERTFTVINNGETNGNVTVPYHYVSEENSLRFVRLVDHQNCGNYKNVFNTLSCAENVQIPYRFTQLFQSCDIDIRTQIKTSYQNIEAYSKDNDGNLVEIIAEKIVNNIGLEDKRDCIYYSYDGKLAVLFLTGNTYDYNTTDINGTYELNGLLPPYGIVGTWVETAYGNLQIIDIRLADDGKRSLILNLSITIDPAINGTIQTIYNRDSYNIWELPINMNDYLDKQFNVLMRFYQDEPDETFPDVYYISEKISVKTRWHRSIEIIWYHSTNTDIYYYSGIKMKNRLVLCDISELINDGSVENQKTDSQVISIDAENYDGVKFQVINVTTGIVRKLNRAFKKDNLIIENIPYKLMENPEISKQGKSNFYTFTANLLEAGDVENIATSGTQTIYTNVEPIGMIEGNDNEFIRVI